MRFRNNDRERYYVVEQDAIRKADAPIDRQLLRIAPLPGAPSDIVELRFMRTLKGEPCWLFHARRQIVGVPIGPSTTIVYTILKSWRLERDGADGDRPSPTLGPAPAIAFSDQPERLRDLEPFLSTYGVWWDQRLANPPKVHIVDARTRSDAAPRSAMERAPILPVTAGLIIDRPASTVTDPANGQKLVFSPRHFEDALRCRIEDADGALVWSYTIGESADSCYAGRALVFYPVQQVLAPSGPVPAGDTRPIERLTHFLGAYRTAFVNALSWAEPRIVDDRRPLQV